MDIQQAVVALATIAADQRRRIAALAAAVAPAAAAAPAPVDGSLDGRLAQTDANIQAVVDQVRGLSESVNLLVSQRASDAELLSAQMVEISTRLGALESFDASQPATSVPDAVAAELEVAVSEAARG